jgi:hypothetical protein
METLYKKYPAVVELVFENQAAYDADRAVAIHVRVPIADKGLYGNTHVYPVPFEFVRQLRYLEAVKISDGGPETIERLKGEFVAQRSRVWVCVQPADRIKEKDVRTCRKRSPCVPLRQFAHPVGRKNATTSTAI